MDITPDITGPSLEDAEAETQRRLDLQERGGKLVEKRERWKQDRQPHEQQWFISAAFDRGNHYVEWNPATNQLTTAPKAPPHRIRLKINRIQAKNRARTAKFLKNRPKPICTPATTEFRDYLNAKATQKAVDYQWRRLKLEIRYKEAVLWAKDCAKGFWWYHWDPTVVARQQIKDPMTGQLTYQEAQLGDIKIEAGSPFEVLVADPGIARIADQPEIMRITLRPEKEMQARYPDIEFDTGDDDHSLFQFERKIAGLSSTSAGLGTQSPAKKDQKQDQEYVLVSEHFARPSAEFPKGTYTVMVGSTVVKFEEELPYGFSTMENPYPVTEFPDMSVPGQFWNPTISEQMIDIQREYNLLQSKLSEYLRLMAFPKLFAARQQALPKGAWSSEAGEFIEYVAIPNVPPPTPWVPPPISNDLWRALELLKSEFDDVTQIFPAAEGKAGGATSGFQTNLLQEATDSVHSQDIRNMELAIEEAFLKIRRMMKLGYTQPRLMAVMGSNYSSEVFEFASAQIDEMADLVVEVGSGMPTLKAARQDLVMNLYNSGLMGPQQDPEVRRKALSLLELGSMEDAFDFAKTDENQARWENLQMSEGRPSDQPHFWENHQIHYTVHSYWLKSAEGRLAQPMARRAVIEHLVLHARFINPQSALQIGQEEQVSPEVMQQVQMMLPPPPPPGMPAQPSGVQGPVVARPGAPPQPPAAPGGPQG